MEYRIKEYLGRFIIEVKELEIRKSLWGIIRDEVWYSCNEFGDAYNPQYRGGRPIRPNFIDDFKTLSAARKQIKEWREEKQAKPIYHNP